MKIQLFAVIMALLLVAEKANASTCARETVQRAGEWADVIFAGEVTKVQYVDARNGKFSEPRIIVTFKVSDAWKGDVHQTMTLHTNYNEISLSGLGVNEGDRFLIYAKRMKARRWLEATCLEGRVRQTLSGPSLPEPDDDIFQDGGSCLRSGPLIRADEDLKALGESKIPDK